MIIKYQSLLAQLDVLAALKQQAETRALLAKEMAESAALSIEVAKNNMGIIERRIQEMKQLDPDLDNKLRAALSSSPDSPESTESK